MSDATATIVESTPSLTKELGKAFVVTTAQSAGMYAGLAIVLFAAGSVLNWNEKRKNNASTAE